MKINPKKLLNFLKTQGCEPIFERFYQENGGFLKAGNLKIYGNFKKDNGFYSGQIIDFTTLEQSADRGEKVEIEIVEFGTKRRKAKSLDDIVKNFKN